MKETLKKDLESRIRFGHKPKLKFYCCQKLDDISDIETASFGVRSNISDSFLSYCEIHTCLGICTVQYVELLKYGVLPLRKEKFKNNSKKFELEKS